MSDENSSANDFNEMRRQKSENARKQREITAKIEREKLDEEKKNSEEKYEQLHRNIKQMVSQENQKKKFIVAADLLTLTDVALMDLYDKHTNFIEKCLITVEIKKRVGKE